MPIYEYHCEKCDKDFECLILGSDQPACNDCNSTDVKRLMSACGFVSKGGDGGGETVSSSSGSSCGGCAATSCAGCGH